MKTESSADDADVEHSRQLEFHNNSNPETNPMLLAEKNQAQNTCSSDFPVRRDMIFVSFTLWYIISLTCKPTSMACNPKPWSYSQSSWPKALNVKESTAVQELTSLSLFTAFVTKEEGGRDILSHQHPLTADESWHVHLACNIAFLLSLLPARRLP